MAELLHSDEQRQSTGEAVGVPPLDSVVCGFDGRYTSLVERGLM